MGRDHRGLLIVLGVLILFVLLGPLLGGGMIGMTGWGDMGPGMMGGYFHRGLPPGTAGSWTWGLALGLGWLVRLAFWGALIIGIVLLVRWLRGSTAGPTQPPRESALDILRRRYAAGEVTREEYERMRAELER